MASSIFLKGNIIEINYSRCIGQFIVQNSEPWHEIISLLEIYGQYQEKNNVFVREIRINRLSPQAFFTIQSNRQGQTCITAGYSYYKLSFFQVKTIAFPRLT